MAKIYFKNENCFTTLENMAKANYKIDLVLTSPPYATSRSKVKTQKAMDSYNRRYDICLDDMTPEQYRILCFLNLFPTFLNGLRI